VVADTAGARLTPGLRGFISKSMREEWSQGLGGVRRWEGLGCDEVGDRRLERLGGRVARVCYARAIGDGFRRLVSVAYTAEGRATELDSYSY
jgi:hypothetical protein